MGHFGNEGIYELLPHVHCNRKPVYRLTESYKDVLMYFISIGWVIGDELYDTTTSKFDLERIQLKILID